MDRREVLVNLAGFSLAAGLAGCSRRGTTPGGEASVAPSAVGSGLPSGDGKATAADYAWFETGSRLSEGHCLTWVKGLPPETVAKRLGARILGRHVWPENGWHELPDRASGEFVLAITQTAGWALVVEDGGSFVIGDEVLGKLSEDTRLVANYVNVTAEGRFVLAENGVVQVAFAPRIADEREGAQPDRLLADMQAAGLNPSGEGPDSDDPAYRDVRYAEAALALTERVTGVKLTAPLLHTSTYLAVAVPDPSGGAVNEEPEIRTAGP